MISQLIAEGAAASSSKGMLGGTGPADIQIGQAAPGAAMEDEASQGVGRFHEASLRGGTHFRPQPDLADPSRTPEGRRRLVRRRRIAAKDGQLGYAPKVPHHQRRH